MCLMLEGNVVLRLQAAVLRLLLQYSRGQPVVEILLCSGRGRPGGYGYLNFFIFFLENIRTPVTYKYEIIINPYSSVGD